MTPSTAVPRAAARHTPEDDAPIADLVDHAAIDVATRGLIRVTDAGALDREDAGTWFSGLLRRRIEHHCSRSEHLLVDVTTHRAVRLVLIRHDTREPMIYMAQSPGTGTGSKTDFYQELVDAARPGAGPVDS
ncbi:hypothetical protein [Amycolatopsis thailandensis]|uniref:hypothetical protein n=1 Tax=Amycolatopsis thailandensis TaxID=589330 RepID=UPI00142E4110|nr:hypothetical protein [Amycolatopsis thailandensis]